LGNATKPLAVSERLTIAPRQDRDGGALLMATLFGL
jgi:hypothetical protein